MNSTEKDLLDRLETMPFEEARSKILTRSLGNSFDSPNHEFCLSWLRNKELELRDLREEESLSISRKALRISESAALSSERATRIAISAIALSIIMAIYEIMKHYQIV